VVLYTCSSSGLSPLWEASALLVHASRDMYIRRLSIRIAVAGRYMENNNVYLYACSDCNGCSSYR
jgi:hypothetical protein